ncbi:hypothetical protein FHY33_001414 [Xanthomonas arboricola]|nr:hypothetical protein [Xanthomonas campestris]
MTVRPLRCGRSGIACHPLLPQHRVTRLGCALATDGVC